MTTLRKIPVETFSSSLLAKFYEDARQVDDLFRRPVVENRDCPGWPVAALSESDIEAALDSCIGSVLDSLPDEPRRCGIESALMIARELHRNRREGIREAKDLVFDLCGDIRALETEAVQKGRDSPPFTPRPPRRPIPRACADGAHGNAGCRVAKSVGK